MKKDKHDEIFDLRDQPDKKLVAEIQVWEKISFEVDFLRHLIMECVEDRGDSKVFLYNLFWKKRYYKVPNDSILVWRWDWFYHLNCDKYNDVIEDVDL